MSKTCPCCSQKNYSDCCKSILADPTEAESPEALMRSRYTAYTQKNIEYLKATTDPQTYDAFDWESIAEWAKNSEFTALEVLRSSSEKNKGHVEFIASFKNLGTDAKDVEEKHHELSSFRRQNGQWYFRSGKQLNPE